MRNRIIPYNPELKNKARKLRNDSTLAEVLLWCEIKNKQLKGYQFHRQVPMLEYIVDFYCHELQLVIEIDGDSHIGKEAYDSKRQTQIENYDVQFLRFDDLDVKNNMAFVLDTILHKIIEITSPSPPSKGE